LEEQEMTFLDFIAHLLIPNILHHKNNILAFCEEEGGEYTLTLKRKTKSGIKTIIMNHDKLSKCYQEHKLRKYSS
jgi:hypothetical protein